MLPSGRLALAVVVCLLVVESGSLSEQAPSGVAIDPDDIGGVVEGPGGPEIGVWVIAETDDLPTRYRKIVVTDGRGRFVVPDLPRATYRLWVRGYGLSDSTPVDAVPGDTVKLMAVAAASLQEAARIYPASYWYSLLEIPSKDEFPGTGDNGNGISPDVRSQGEWLSIVKLGCVNCHQMGDHVTRTVAHLPVESSSAEAWDYRLRIGQRHAIMNATFNLFGRERGLKMYADWTDRIEAGAVPVAPPRPVGLERNLVLTMWDWGAPTSYVHDLVSTDKRAPTVNPDGLVYGVDYSRDYLTILDPAEGKVRELKVPTRDDPEGRSSFPSSIANPSAFWGEERIWMNPASPHNPMMDQQGRIWITQKIRRDQDQPEFCQGATHPSAQFFPIDSSSRQVTVFDPDTQEFTFVDTCFTAHHLQFDEDRDDTLYFSAAADDTIGWVDTKLFGETGDSAQSQGWCPTVLDTNGDGKAGPFVLDPTPTGGLSGIVPLENRSHRRVVTPGMDLRIIVKTYGIAVNPVDHSIWAGSPEPFPGVILRYDPKTCVAEAYEPPFDNPVAPNKMGSMPRGIDIDRDGVVWTGLAGTGHIASFDRSKCNVLNGPTATGQHCPEGWTLYPSPGPQFKGVRDLGSADFHYYNWVDQHNTLGLGKNVPITNGTNSDSLIALLPDTGQALVLRVPYPVGFFTRGLDGRVDDPEAGWKGRGLWANNATNTLWHVEGGKGTRGAVVHFQLRPDVLAK